MGQAASNRGLRLVERIVLHEGPIPFVTLAERVVTSRTRYLVLDLDRTVHLGRNMGELVGWELTLLHTFGAQELDAMEPERVPGRLLFDRRRVLGSVRYLLEGARTWAIPGLYYLFLGKIPAKRERSRRWAFKRFGDEPMRTVQRVPQNNLLRLMESVTEQTLRELAARVWDRHARDQVVRREDLDRLRERNPGLRVVLTSASPQAVVEVAGERLGADVVEGSVLGRINSGPAKIERLRRLLPDLFDPSVETVGFTDTGHGEDHCWADHFTYVVDVNSDTPFSPLVDNRSPVRAIHSAHPMTRQEETLRDLDVESWMDPRRPMQPRPDRRAYELPELRRRLGGLLDQTATFEGERAWRLDRARREARRHLETVARSRSLPN